MNNQRWHREGANHLNRGFWRRLQGKSHLHCISSGETKTVLPHVSPQPPPVDEDDRLTCTPVLIEQECAISHLSERSVR
jgi:hypothetical protein